MALQITKESRATIDVVDMGPQWQARLKGLGCMGHPKPTDAYGTLTTDEGRLAIAKDAG